jgi:hypothetical protein
MATSYTTLLGLALPVQGELSGTWGDTVNNYITNYLDAAVAGTLTVSGDTTLTKTTNASLGATSSQYAIIIASPASANITVTAPAASKIYTIINTSGTYTVTIRGAGPTTGVTLGVNEKAQVAWNGSDFVRIGASGGAGVFSSITNTGLTSGRVVYSTTNGLETDSANLTFDGTTLTAAGLAGPHNGTVGATTPTTGVFTTVTARAAATQDSVILQGRAGGTSSYGVTFTPTTLTASRTLTLPDASGTILQSGTTVTTGQGGTGLTSFTANGVVYASSSSVLATGSALTFDGSLLTSSTGVTSAVGGGGKYTIAYTTANANSRSWRIANDLNVFGDFAIQQSTTQTGSTFRDVYTSLNDGTSYWSVGGSEQMRLTSTGLGIGTSSPSAKLDVNSSAAAVMRLTRNGGTAANTALQYFNGTVSWYAGMSASGLYSIGYNDAALDSGAFRLDTSGNLGLGVTPSAWGTGKAFELGQVIGNALWGLGINSLYLVSNARWDGSNYRYTNNGAANNYGVGTGNGTFTWFTAPSGTAGNAITFTQAMTLDASGNLLVGTTSNPQNSKLMVGGTVQVKPAANTSLEIIGPNIGTGIRLFARNDAGTLNRLELQGGQVIFPLTSGADGLYFDATSGNLGIGTSSPSASAILDAQSTTKGVRMPNMTTTQKNAIVSPAAGLMVFDTTLAKLCVYSGSAWQTITSV